MFTLPDLHNQQVNPIIIHGISPIAEGESKVLKQKNTLSIL